MTKEKKPTKYKASGKKKNTYVSKGQGRGIKPGDKLWMLKQNFYNNRTFANGEELMQACLDYFEYAKNDPVIQEKVDITYHGDVVKTELKIPRAMTLWGICSFMGITCKTWENWRKSRDDLKAVIYWAEQIIKEQKFTHAAAGVFNASIIAKELHLAERHVHETTPPNMALGVAGEKPVQPHIHEPTDT